MNPEEIVIEYNSEGHISKVHVPSMMPFVVTSQVDKYIGNKLTSSTISNAPIAEGGDDYE